MKLRILATTFLILATSSVLAKEVKQPFFLGCHPVGYTFTQNGVVVNPLIVEEQKQTLYLFHNRATTDIKIKADLLTDPNLIPALTIDLSGDNWATFATHKTGLSFACYNLKGEQVSCKDVLEICQYPRAKFSGGNNGTYWLAVNQSKFAARDEAVRKGVLLRNWYPGWQQPQQPQQLPTSATVQ